MVIKKNHHYVWAHYLRGWSDDNKNIWHLTEKGKSDLYGIKGLASARNFYKLKNISPSQKEYVSFLINSFPDINRSIIKSQFDVLCLVLKKVEDLEDCFIDSDRPSIEAGFIRSNYIEDIHSHIESDMFPMINRIRSDPFSLKYEDVFTVDFFCILASRLLVQNLSGKE